MGLVGFGLVIEHRGFIGSVFHVPAERARHCQVITSGVKYDVDRLPRDSQLADIYSPRLVLPRLQRNLSVKRELLSHRVHVYFIVQLSFRGRDIMGNLSKIQLINFGFTKPVLLVKIKIVFLRACL